jgi:hypothetical protein
MRFPILLMLVWLFANFAIQAASTVRFDVRSAGNGKWSDANTWMDKRVPRAGDNVQVRTGHVVTFDANSDDAVRVLQMRCACCTWRER